MSVDDDTTPLTMSFDGSCFLSFNSADAMARSVAEDVTARFKRLQIKTYNYQVDPNPQDKWAAIKAELETASSVAFFVGKEDLGKIQERVEVDWALTATAQNGGVPHLFIVLLPGATESMLPKTLSEPWRVTLEAADLHDGRLTESGFTKVCGGLLRQKTTVTQRAIAGRERELFLTRPARARALLVGIGNYTDPTLDDLDAPAHDIAELGAVLRSLELPGGVRWETVPQYNLDGKALQVELQRFFVDDAREDDLLLFYFSGHGTTQSGDPYLVPRDGRAGTPRTSMCVAADALAEWLETSPAWAAIAVLDCCHGHNVTGTAQAVGQPARSVVLAAAAGPTPAIGPDGLSPFTSALVGILGSGGPLTMGQLDAQLRQRHPSTRSLVGALGAVENLTLGTPTISTPVQPERPTGRVRVAVAPSREPEATLLLQLTRLTDALAIVGEGGAEIDSLVAGSRKLIAERLRDLTEIPEGSASWDELDRSDTSPLLEVMFDGKDMHAYADLPWEYLRLASAEEPSFVTRVVPIAATKAADDIPPAPRSALILSEPAASWGDWFRAMTRGETGLPENAFVGSAEGWARLRHSNADVIAIQCGLQANGHLAFGNGLPVRYLKSFLEPTPVRYVILETIADQTNPGAAAALRVNAFQVAADTGRSVIAVCHPLRYVARLREIENVEQSGSPTFSFAAQVLKRLKAGMRVEDAAYGARQEVADNLMPIVDVLGMPVVVRAEPRQAATSTASSSPHLRPTEPAVPPKPGSGFRP